MTTAEWLYEFRTLGKGFFFSSTGGLLSFNACKYLGRDSGAIFDHCSRLNCQPSKFQHSPRLKQLFRLLFLVKQLRLIDSEKTSLGSEFHSHVQVFATSCVLIAVCMNLNRSASRTLFPSACALQRLSLFCPISFPVTLQAAILTPSPSSLP